MGSMQAGIVSGTGRRRGGMVLRLGAVACVFACASAPKPAPPTVPTRSPAPLPRSSILAVLSDRAALRLDDDQAKRLEQLQADLDRRQADIRQGKATPAAPEVTTNAAGARPVEGRRRSGRALGDSTGSQRGRDASKGSRGGGANVDRALDDADTAAFLEAEKIFRDGQRERAREVAEKYREDLFDAREAARRTTSAGTR